MSSKEALEQINLFLLDGKIDEAEKRLNALKTSELAGQRARAHFQGLIAFHKGDIQKAKEIMEAALNEFGSNVNLLRDLMVCQYHLHEMIFFRANLEKFELLLLENESILSEKSLLDCERTLGKFLEDDGRLAPAYLFYERTLARSANSPTHRIRALIQKALWKALYEPDNELSSLYRELISVPDSLLTKGLKVELQHSLMTIELRLIGADHAWQRIQRLGQDLAEMDKRQLVFDFIEGVMMQDLPYDREVLRVATEFRTKDPFETFILDLALGKMSAPEKIKQLEILATKLSWANYLRLLCLTANMENGNTSTRQELNRKIQLIVMSLDSRTQGIWNQRLRQALQTPEIRAEVSLRNRSLTIQGKTVDLSKKKIALQLISGLLGKKTLTIDQAIQLLWETSFTPEHYHRLRMSTHRLNSLIHEATGLGKIIEVDSQAVRLRPEVRLRSYEDVLEMDLANL